MYICKDYPDIIRTLIKKDIDIDVVDEEGNNALKWC